MTSLLENGEAVQPRDRAHLRSLVVEIMRRIPDLNWVPDDSTTFDYWGHRIRVLTPRQGLRVELFCQVVDGIESYARAHLETALLNRDHALVKWTVRDRRIQQTLTFPGTSSRWWSSSPRP